MARKRRAERVTVGDFTWEEHRLGSDPERECWRLLVDGLHVSVTDYGEADSEYFSGWRVVEGGAPCPAPYDSRDEAMKGALGAMRSQARHHLERDGRNLERSRRAAQAVGLLT